MGKKKTDSQKPKKTASFEELVSKTSLDKMKPFIKQEVGNLGQMLVQNISSQLEGAYTRLMTLEDILCKELNYTQDQLAMKVAETEDSAAGFTTREKVQEGDRVRIEIATKTKDQKAYQGNSRIRIEEVGSGKTLGRVLEKELIGMAVDETKEVEFGEEMVCKITINRVSYLDSKEEVVNDQA